MTPQPHLARTLKLNDAVFIGIGSMLGAGVFTVFTPAAHYAGPFLLIAVALAAIVALTNALSTAQLAISYPQAGGTYVYGRKLLNPTTGFIAGWGFVVGKTASTAAIALTFSAYAAPQGYHKLVAVAAVCIVTIINIRGVTRTARATKILVIPVLSVFAVLFALASTQWNTAPHTVFETPTTHSINILTATGLLFFAFAGYARIATLAEEVAAPRRTIPKAIMIALLTVLSIYVALTLCLTHFLPHHTLATAHAPLLDLAQALNASWLSLPLTAAAALATLGALLTLMSGISRTALAMARDRELPHTFAALTSRWQTPARAEIFIAACSITLILTTDVTQTIGISSMGVLIYYAIAHLSALQQPREQRIIPRIISACGGIACLILAFSVPLQSLIFGATTIIAGLTLRALMRHRLRA
ncbi:APC family permease [Timonella sp. A28]|uniref:APC family permease n=1 Tax=Timonella sp. A28 TaxID=3442640 RepID=UPI003EBF70FB